MAQIDFFDGTSGLAHEAKVYAHNSSLIIYANGKTHTIAAQDVHPTLSTPNARRFINLPNNMALEFHDNTDAEQLLNTLNAQHLKPMRWFDRNYRSWSFISSAAAVFIALIAGLYFFILPIVANNIAYALPTDLLNRVSQESIQQGQEAGYLKPSQLSAARQAQILQAFNALKKPDTQIPFKLHFYSAPDIGPNAFALPSGDVVLLDELVNITTKDEQIMGVLSHELGHVAHRHTMRGIVQNGIVGFAVAAWLGDYGNAVLNVGASALFSQKYSRDFEREADQYAIKMMKMNHMSPAALADLFVIMEQYAKDNKEKEKENKDNTTEKTTQEADSNTHNHNHSDLLDLLNSHPPTPERIDTLRPSNQ
jgi:Zn-dependent protease with chaperone function